MHEALIEEARRFAMDCAHDSSFCDYCIAAHHNDELKCPLDEGADVARRLADALEEAAKDSAGAADLRIKVADAEHYFRTHAPAFAVEMLDGAAIEMLEGVEQVLTGADALAYVGVKLARDVHMLRAAIDAAKEQR